MTGIVVKDNVRYRAKDAERADITGSVQTKVPVPGTEAWAQAQADEARAALQAELDAERAQFDAEIEERRAAFDRELEERRTAADTGSGEVSESGDVVAVVDGAEQAASTEEPSTKVDDPEVTKDRTPTTTKGRGSK